MKLARQARVKSKTGIYHVMLRGNECKPVFRDEEDKNRFVEIMLQKKEEAGSLIYAYCVMDNHVHMVVHERETGQPLETLMKRIGVTYALYFNRKYKRVGHVFQDRFRSEAIEAEPYMLSLIRYIHSNPVKANISQELNYAWSSYWRYSGKLPLLPEMAVILGRFASERQRAMALFREFQREKETREFLDLPADIGTGANARDILNAFLQRQNWRQEDLRRRENRGIVCDLIGTLVRRGGMSGREAAAITGLSREIVRRMLLSAEEKA